MKEKNKWFHDYITPVMLQLHTIGEVVYSGKTQYQSVEIIELGDFGKCLILDSKIQSSEFDEFVYHEALVHPAMFTHPNPERVFIAGGGEGATLREVLAHQSVKKAVMVDIDKEVVDICRKYLPSLHQGSFEDSRAEIHYDDAEAQLKSSQGNFDVIVIDLPEPLEQGPAYHLYTKEFYQFLRGKLSPQGVLCLQAGYSTWGNHLMFTAICHTLKAVFPLVFPYQTHIPSFGGIWGFALASQKFSPLQLPSADIDRTISSRLKGSLRFYDGATHHGMFLLPRHLRAEIEGEKRVISDKDPLFVFQP